MTEIGEQMADGYRETEIAAQLGRTPSWVSERLAELRTEILLQNRLLPPLTDAERAALTDSLRRYGQLVPLLVTTDLKLLDGWHRLHICDQLGIEPRYQILEGLTDAEEWEISVALNASRRSMTRQQRRKLIEHELMRDAGRSDRRIAAMCGVTHHTVADVRKEIDGQQATYREQGLGAADGLAAEASDDDVGKLPTSPSVKAVHVVENATERYLAVRQKRTDTLGRRQPATRSARPPRDRILAQAACPCCQQPTNIIRHGADTRLEHAQ